MPLGPLDEYLAHQTSETIDRVHTSDRNFYDRYYFNMHSSSDELFVIMGLGQYPNLGVTDAFITVSIGTRSSTPCGRRASSGSERHGHDASAPSAVEVDRRAAHPAGHAATPNEWGIEADLTFTGTVDALEEPRTFIRQSTDGSSQDVTPVRPGRRPGQESSTVAGRHFDRHARPVEGGARPLVGRATGG